MYLLISVISLIPLITPILTQSTLQSVQVVFRHGNRTADIYPSGNNKDNNKIKTGILTNKGKQEMYDLGKFVRERYTDFVKEDYDPAEVKIITSGATRCIQSGELFAYGFYEKYNLNANWSTNGYIPFDPVPIEPIPTDFDRYLQVTDDCPRRYEIESESMKAGRDFYVDLVTNNEKIKQFLDVCSTSLNVSFSLNDKSSAIHLLFKCTDYIEPTEDGVYAKWAEPYIDLYDLIMNQPSAEPTMEYQQLDKGPLLELLFSKMNLTAEHKKIYVYAAHDFTLKAIRILFEQEMKSFPETPLTGSALLLEVHQKPDYEEPILEIYFRNGSSDSTLVKIENIPECSPICFVSMFGKIVEPYVPQNYEKQCMVSGQEPENNTPFSPQLVAIVVAAVVGGVLVLGLLVLILVKSKRYCYNYEQL